MADDTPASSSATFPSPPACMHTDVPSAADGARRHLLPKRSFLTGLIPRRRRRTKSLGSGTQYAQVPSPDHASEQERPAPTREPSGTTTATGELVHLESSLQVDAELDEDYNKDVYRWAILYENQRGLTLFSTPYYSPQGLLPMDPPPFTIPSASRSPSAGQPTVSLSDYPLPDGNWRWVSRAWMVDMRGDGQTQYDGFEYNWFFRSKKWRSEVGNLSAGGWVRRRRWVRLMMRPANPTSSNAAQAPTDVVPPQRGEEGTTRPPSTISVGDSSAYDADVWDGDEDEDWIRCKIALRRAGRDGRKVELWKRWLGRPTSVSSGHSASDLEKSVRIGGPASSSSSIPQDLAALSVAGPAPRERVAAVLRLHGSEILQSFVYPESRAQFVELLAQAGLLVDLQTTPGSPGPLAMLDFWSYASSLDKLPKLDEEP